jgi:heme-binding NEAT domain protein
VLYVTEIGNIEGELAINQDVIFFDPAMNQSNNTLLQKANGTIYIPFIIAKKSPSSNSPCSSR